MFVINLQIVFRSVPITSIGGEVVVPAVLPRSLTFFSNEVVQVRSHRSRKRALGGREKVKRGQGPLVTGRLESRTRLYHTAGRSPARAAPPTSESVTRSDLSSDPVVGLRSKSPRGRRPDRGAEVSSQLQPEQPKWFQLVLLMQMAIQKDSASIHLVRPRLRVGDFPSPIATTRYAPW